MLLTEQEIKLIGEGNTGTWQDDLQFASAIESAVLEKLKTQEPVAYILTNGEVTTNVMVVAAHNLRNHTPATALYEHPLPPADVVRDAHRVAELEAVLRECRVVLSFINRLDDDRDFLDQPEYEQIHKAIAKIDEVLK